MAITSPAHLTQGDEKSAKSTGEFDFSTPFDPRNPVTHLLNYKNEVQRVNIPKITQKWYRVLLVCLVCLLLPCVIVLPWIYLRENFISLGVSVVVVLLVLFLMLYWRLLPCIVHQKFPVLPPLSHQKINSMALEPVETRPVFTHQKVIIVINPFAGKKQAIKFYQELILPAFQERKIEVEELFTTHRLHCYEHLCAKSNLYDYDAIIICGGDGTYNEAANALYHHHLSHSPPSPLSLPSIGLIPLGTSNATISDFLFQPYSTYDKGGAHKEHSLWAHGTPQTKKLILHALERILHPNSKSIPVTSILCQTQRDRKVAINGIFLGALGDINVLAERARFFSTMRYDLAGLLVLLQNSCRSSPHRVLLWDYKGRSYDLLGGFWFATLNLVQHWTDDMRSVGVAQMNRGDMVFFGQKEVSWWRKILVSLHLGDTMYCMLKGRDLYTLISGVVRAEFYFDSPGVFSLEGENFYHDGRIELTTSLDFVRLIVSEADIVNARTHL